MEPIIISVLSGINKYYWLINIIMLCKCIVDTIIKLTLPVKETDIKKKSDEDLILEKLSRLEAEEKIINILIKEGYLKGKDFKENKCRFREAERLIFIWLEAIYNTSRLIFTVIARNAFIYP